MHLRAEREHDHAGDDPSRRAGDTRVVDVELPVAEDDHHIDVDHDHHTGHDNILEFDDHDDSTAGHDHHDDYDGTPGHDHDDGSGHDDND